MLCPNCGQTITTQQPLCPLCGYELTHIHTVHNSMSPISPYEPQAYPPAQPFREQTHTPQSSATQQPVLMMAPPAGSNPFDASTQPYETPSPQQQAPHHYAPHNFATPELPPGAQKPAPRSSRWAIISALLLCVAILIGNGIWTYLRAGTTTPKQYISEYVDAIAAGDFQTATSMTDPNALPTYPSPLLTKNMSQSGSTISDVFITEDGTGRADVSFILDGQVHSGSVRVTETSRTFGIYPHYTISEPLIMTMSLKAPSFYDSANINGEWMKLSDVGAPQGSPADFGTYSDAGIYYFGTQQDYTVAAYPGVYTIGLETEDTYFYTPTLTVDAFSQAFDVEVDFTQAASESFETSLTGALRTYARNCVDHTEAEAAGCDFQNPGTTYGDTTPQSVTRTISGGSDSITIAEIDVDRGVFYSSSVMSTIDTDEYSIMDTDRIIGTFTPDGSLDKVSSANTILGKTGISSDAAESLKGSTETDNL